MFKNKGNGTFAAALDSRAGGGYAGYAPLSGLDRADLDGDGDEDLAIGIDLGRELEPGALVMLCRGDGYFGGTSGESRYYLSTYGSDGDIFHTNDIDFVHDILINDLDGDGDRDLATTGSSNDVGDNKLGNLHVFLGNGDGTFQDPQRLGTNEGNYAMTDADFDRDGDMDLATVNSNPSGKVSVLANAGNATFGDESTVHPTFGVGDDPRAIIRAHERRQDAGPRGGQRGFGQRLGADKYHPVRAPCRALRHSGRNEGRGIVAASALLLARIQRSAWKVNSANFYQKRKLKPGIVLRGVAHISTKAHGDPHHMGVFLRHELGYPRWGGASRTMKSRIREVPTEGEGTRVLLPHTTMLLRHLEERRVKTLVRSLNVLDEWLEQNERHTDDEVRLRRMKRWREEALEQLALLLEPDRP